MKIYVTDDGCAFVTVVLKVKVEVAWQAPLQVVASVAAGTATVPGVVKVVLACAVLPQESTATALYV